MIRMCKDGSRGILEVDRGGCFYVSASSKGVKGFHVYSYTYLALSR